MMRIPVLMCFAAMQEEAFAWLESIIKVLAN